jgi:transcription termination/antitermination protein NusG
VDSCIPSVNSPIPAEIAAASENWYALQTFARHEKKVADQLQESAITSFLPLVSEVHRWSDRRKIVQLPLFPCYVFARIAPASEAWRLVHRTTGVLSLVGAAGRAIAIPDKEIEDVRTLMNQHAACAPFPFLKEGRRVRIRGGALDGIEGVIAEINRDRSLVVSIQLIQRSVAVRLAGYDVELV